MGALSTTMVSGERMGTFEAVLWLQLDAKMSVRIEMGR